ncbi:uncharacterized protein LOC111360310 [Spodoptera litura]|uniref:Uncharacterized protein LOC111360310 n=1 Tax=Spodoptera litura TaxID=69820 RepID=A0A9J7EP90_SPOLT|nr:uncharacterized protein LOC111360310 [Spodoptera litura]
MSRVQRSPPVSNKNLEQVSSDSDIPQSLSTSPQGNVNTSSRYKRPRDESLSPQAKSPPLNELQGFKHEVLQMLKKWKNEQETYFKKILDGQASSVTKLASDIAELKSQNASIQKSNMEIEKTVSFISKQYDDILNQMEILKREKTAYKDSFQAMEAKIQDLQVSSRSSTVEIRNVPPSKEKETMADLTNIVNKIGTAINVPINSLHIRDVYRLPGKSGSTRPIITEFASVQTKLEFLTSVRNFNKKSNKEERLSTQILGIIGDRCPIYIAEYLPPSVRKLFYAARQFAKIKQFSYCWTNNENVFLRKSEGDKQILVKTEQMLRDMEVNQ